jgi:hypothetical protein
MRESSFSSRSNGYGEKSSRTYPYSRDLHGPKPEHGEESDRSGTETKRSRRSHEQAASRAVDIFGKLLGGVEPAPGTHFTDEKYGGAEFKIVRILENGNIEAMQVSGGDDSDGNYTFRQTLTAAGLRRVSESEEEAGGTKRFTRSLTQEEIMEMGELLRYAVDRKEEEGAVASEISEISTPEVPKPFSEDPVGSDIVLPKSGTIQGRQYGGVTSKDGQEILSSDSGVQSEKTPAGRPVPGGATLSGSDVIGMAADDNRILAKRKRRGAQERLKSKRTEQDTEPPESPLVEESEAQPASVQGEMSPVNNDIASTMSFEQVPVPETKTTKEDDHVLTGDVLSPEESGTAVRSSSTAENITDIEYEEVKNGPENDAPYKDGSVWVEEYLEETGQLSSAKETVSSESGMSNLPSGSRDTRSEDLGEDLEGLAEDGSMAAPGSADEMSILEAFGKVPDGEASHGEDRETTSEAELQERIRVLTSDCDTARLEYVTADNESRTVMSRLKGVLGISGKGIQNETVTQKKEAYQSKLRELRDLRLELVKLRHIDRVAQSGSVVDEEIPAEELADFPVLEEEISSDEKLSLEEDIEAELLHFAQEVNIGLYNTWSELRSEQKGLIGKLKRFGESYNKLSWQKKLIIGIPVVGLAVASGAGLLGTAMASAAIAAVIARRGVAAAGMFALVDGGLQKLAESRAQKMAEKIVAQGRQETASLETMAADESSEGQMVRSETQTSPEGDIESLDVKLERIRVFMDNHVIDSLGQTLESRVRGQDRRRLGALAGSMGVAFGLPSFMASETGHDLTRAASEKAGKAASWVGETVFGDDYSPKNPPTGGAGAGREAVQATTSSPGASTPSSVRGATGAALEQPISAKVAESAGGISGILGKEITLAKGDSVWKLAGNMAKELGVRGEAENLYFTDALKDAYLAKGGNPNIKAGAVFDWKKYLGAEDIQKTLNAANSLSPEQKASILANKAKNIAAAISGNQPSGLMAESSLRTTPGEVTKYPNVLQGARDNLNGNSSSYKIVGESGGVRPSTTVMSASNGRYTEYRIDGVRPDQLTNATETSSAASGANDSGISVETTPRVQGVPEMSRATVDQISKISLKDFTKLYDLSAVSAGNTLEIGGVIVSADGVHTLGRFLEGPGRQLATQALERNPNITLGELLKMYGTDVGGVPSSPVEGIAGSKIATEAVPQGRDALESSNAVGGGANGFVKVADTAWEGRTPTIDLIRIDQVRPIVDKVPNMSCQEFFQVYLDAKDNVSNHYDQIDTLTFQGGLNWAEVDTFAQFINGFTDPDSGRKLIVQAVRANPNITLKEFVEMYAPTAEASPSSMNAIIGETSSTARPTESSIVSGGAQTGVEVAENEVQSVESIGSEPAISDTPQPVEFEQQPAPIIGTTVVASSETVIPEPAEGSAVVAGEGGISGGDNGESLAFSQHVEPDAGGSFQQVRYEASDNPPQRNGIVRGPAPRTGMPPAGGFESNPKVPGIGPINLMELQFAEQKLQFGPAAKLTLRQLAESTKDPSKIPGGVTPEDLAKIKRLLARVPGTNTGAFILQNGNTTVRQFIQDNIRVRIPRPGSTSI